MRVSRLTTQFIDFPFRQNESGNREPMKIIGEELERVAHFKCLGTNTEEECCVETEITVRMGPGWRKWVKCRVVLILILICFDIGGLLGLYVDLY